MIAATIFQSILRTTALTAVPHSAPTGISAASIGIPDTFFLMLLALIVFGPRRLPEIGRQIGKLMYEFRKVSNDFKFQMEEELRASEEAERVRKLEALNASNQPVLNVSNPDVSQPDVASLNVPPHPVSDSPESWAAADGAVSAGYHAVDESAPSVEGEVRAEVPALQTPTILPPVDGETVAAQKPFRYRVPETVPEAITESGSPATHEPSEPITVSDEGRTGFEVQPGIEVQPRPTSSEHSSPRAEAAEQELHHG